MKKLILLMLTVASLMSCFTFYTVADEATMPTPVTYDVGITPFFSNVNNCSLDFAIREDGLAGVTASYWGMEGITTRVACEIYIEKKMLGGLYWKKIDLGEPAGTLWVDVSNQYQNNFSHTVQLPGTGTYRAVFELTFQGNGGPDDVIKDTLERKYS